MNRFVPRPFRWVFSRWVLCLALTVLGGEPLTWAQQTPAQPAQQTPAQKPPAAQKLSAQQAPAAQRGQLTEQTRNNERSEPAGLATSSAPAIGPGSGSTADSGLSSDIADIINNLDYPEIQVVPRASERIRFEAREEERSWYYMHWPIQLSGMATLLAGTLGRSQLRDSLNETEKNDANSVLAATQAVGAGWVVAGVLLGLQKPYRSAYYTISKYPGKDERSILMRERLAEEALERPARLIKPLQIASVVTNFSLCVLSGTFMTDQGRLIAGVSAVLAFLPMIFEDHTVHVYEKHLEYKKKIYGPLSSASVGYDPKSRSFYPTAMLTWSY